MMFKGNCFVLKAHAHKNKEMRQQPQHFGVWAMDRGEVAYAVDLRKWNFNLAEETGRGIA